MELFAVIALGVFVLLGGFGIAMYRSDREGWDIIFKRISRNVRASIGSRQEKKALTAFEIMPEDDAREAWAAEFKGKPKEIAKYDPVPKEYIPSTIEKPKKLKHEIVKTDYYKSSFGPWPQWTCRCGVKGHTPVSSSLERAQKSARADGEDHVKEMNKAEEVLNKTNGKFSF